jgi:glutamate dehydrogenase/leucine dehydrogenase
MFLEAEMFTTEMPLRRDSILSHLQEAAEWERAAQFLDVDPLVLERVRRTEVELSSRHMVYLQETATRVTLHVAGTDLYEGSNLLGVQVTPEASLADATRNAVELQISAALANCEQGTGSISLQTPTHEIPERELCRVANECAPVVARLCGGGRLLPTENSAVAFSQWMAHAALAERTMFSAPSLRVDAYVQARKSVQAKALLHLCKLALRDLGKKGAARFSLVGTSSFLCTFLDQVQKGEGSVVAVADESGGISSARGLQTRALLQHLSSGGLVAEVADGEHVSRGDVMASAAEVLILDPPEVEVTEHHAGALRACVVLDVSGKAVSAAAMKGLEEEKRIAVSTRLTSAAMLIGELHISRGFGQKQHERTEEGVEELWSAVSALGAKFQVGISQATLLLVLQRLADRDAVRRP